MKKIIFLFPLLAMMACNDSKKTDDGRQTMLDSIKSANYANEVRQRTIDSMNTITSSTPIPIEDNIPNNPVAVGHPKKHEGSHHHDSPNTNGNPQTNNGPTTATAVGTPEGTTPTSTAGDNSTTSTDKKKKKMSNTTKGAIIGAGAGVVTGVITGAATSKDKTKGAVVGGIIGGAVGSGVGYGIGAKKDKKDTIKK